MIHLVNHFCCLHTHKYLLGDHSFSPVLPLNHFHKSTKVHILYYIKFLSPPNTAAYLFSHRYPPKIQSQGSEVQNLVFITSVLDIENTNIIVSVIMFLWFVIIFVWCEKYVIQIMDDSKKYPKWSNGSA